MERFEPWSQERYEKKVLKGEKTDNKAYLVPGIVEYLYDPTSPPFMDNAILDLIKNGIGEMGLDKDGRVYFASFGEDEDLKYFKPSKEYKTYEGLYGRVPEWAGNEHLIPGFYEWRTCPDNCHWNSRPNLRDFPYNYMSYGLGEIKGRRGNWLWELEYPLKKCQK